jgi:hypothetical protein
MADIRYGFYLNDSLQAQREREMDTAADEKEVTQAATNIQRMYLIITKLVALEVIWAGKWLEK